MVFAKKVTKTPAVMVETKKMTAKDNCGMGMCPKMKHFFVIILLIVNTILLISVFSNQTRLESDRVGGKDNYKMVQQIYKSDAFKAQQKQQIEQALSQYQQGAAKQAVQAQPAAQVPAVTQ
ncbi:MAG: hypothetical protein NTY80_03070 [candidate division SR1 bacterium]|nr:hypothetical protein [candidate division SR1 bacterium]